IAKGVRFVRTAVMLNENLIVFADQLSADKPHTFDLATHCNGTWQTPPPGGAFTLPAQNGYQHLKNATLCRTNAALAQTFSLAPDWRGVIALAAGEPTEVITATGVGKSTADRILMTIFRRTAAQTTFVWALALDGTAPTLQAVLPQNPRLDPTIGVRIASGTSSWQLAINTAKATVGVTPLPTAPKGK
ncbi:MAG: hypothetical protein NTY53_15320, partial [Kiritimatiellaeota bacterium]|nr:hypothetical protein [Kiritimatiellota bacterium]